VKVRKRFISYSPGGIRFSYAPASRPSSRQSSLVYYLPPTPCDVPQNKAAFFFFIRGSMRLRSDRIYALRPTTNTAGEAV